MYLFINKCRKIFNTDRLRSGTKDFISNFKKKFLYINLALPCLMTKAALILCFISQTFEVTTDCFDEVIIIYGISIIKK